MNTVENKGGGISRRGFLKLAGAGVSLAAAGKLGYDYWLASEAEKAERAKQLRIESEFQRIKSEVMAKREDAEQYYGQYLNFYPDKTDSNPGYGLPFYTISDTPQIKKLYLEKGVQRVFANDPIHRPEGGYIIQDLNDLLKNHQGIYETDNKIPLYRQPMYRNGDKADNNYQPTLVSVNEFKVEYGAFVLGQQFLTVHVPQWHDYHPGGTATKEPPDGPIVSVIKSDTPLYKEKVNKEMQEKISKGSYYYYTTRFDDGLWFDLRNENGKLVRPDSVELANGEAPFYMPGNFVKQLWRYTGREKIEDLSFTIIRFR